MSSLTERMSRAHLHVTLPGAELHAGLRYPNNATITIGDTFYALHTERSLERCLENLGRLLFVAWIREYRAVLRDSSIEIRPEDQHARDYLAACAESKSTGTSGDGRITIKSVDLQNIGVRMVDGTIYALTHTQFAASVEEAIAALIDDHRAKIRRLKSQFFGVTRPPAARVATAGPRSVLPG